LSLEIYDDISIPYVIRTDQKKGFVRKGILCHIFHLCGGKVTYQFDKNQRFLGLAFKFQVKLLKNNNPFGVLSP
jgi:hypothetical protein